MNYAPPDLHVAAEAPALIRIRNVTKSYGANRVKLGRYGLEAEVRAVNTRAAEIARGVAGERACVAGAIG